MKNIVNKIRPAIFFLFIVFMIVGSLNLMNHQERNKKDVLSANSAGNNVKHLKSYISRKSRSLCATPARGHTRCLSKATLNSDGDLLTGSPAVMSGYGPSEFHTAYNLPCEPSGAVASICAQPGSFGPGIIAIVDAGNITSGGASVESSLQTYNQHFGLPSCTIANGCLTIVNQSGNTSPLPGSVNGWELEIALDVEAAHMICQTCKILLVEASSSSIANMAAATVTAASFNPIAISNSYGVDSFDFPAYDSSYKHPGIAVIASSGDSGSISNGKSWPADIPEVISAAGTRLTLNNDNSWASETVWSGSGGGCAASYTAPDWQISLDDWASNGCATKRAFGDISADADPNTGAAISLGNTWYQVGGTSLSAPLLAGMFGLVGNVPDGVTASSIPYASFNNTNFHDVTTGTNCTYEGQTNCSAQAGFDTPSGVGTPNGLGGFTLPPTKPGTPSLRVTDATHVRLSWSASSATIGISGYKIYRNGDLIATTGSTTYTDSGLNPNTNYTYHVVAIDNVSNTSAASDDANITTYYPSDINFDYHVNLLDFSLFVSKYGLSDDSIGRSDINGDGIVNLLDFSLLVSDYGAE